MSALPQYGFKAEEIVKQGRTSTSNIEDVKKWLTYKPNIPKMTEEQIVLFLLACDNIVENTQVTIENYFKHKILAPELFTDRDVDSKENQFTNTVTHFAISPNRTKENYVVGMASLKDTSFYNFCLDQQVKVAFTLIDVFLHSDPPDGLVFLLNLKGVGIMHLTKLKFGILKKFFNYLQEALPTQLKQVHVINATYIFEKILAIIKPFMKKELFELIIPHPAGTDMNEFFQKHIPADCVPADFGGDLPSLDQLSEDTQEQWRKLKSFFDEEEKQVQMYKIEN